MFKFFENSFVGGDFHFFFRLVQNDFLLNKGDEVGEEVVKNESAGEVNHDDEKHDGHHRTHLGGGHIVDFGLVEFFTFAGFLHELAEAFALGLARRAKLFGGEILNKTGEDGEEEREDGGWASEAWVGLKVDEAKEAGMEFVSGGYEGVLFFVGLRIVGFGGVVSGLFFHIFRLKVDDVLDVGVVGLNERVGTKVKIGVFCGGVDHNADGAEDGDKHRELNDEGEERAKRFDVVFFV